MFKSDKSWFCKDLETDKAKKILEDLELAINNNQYAEATRLFQQVKKYMKQRIDENYFLPVKTLNKYISAKEIRTNTAFIIMGINCILIELLYEIKNGFDQANEGDNSIGDVYVSILPLLDDTVTPELAKKFYKGIRCGIIHQGQTKANTALTVDDDFNSVICQNGQYYLSNPKTVFTQLTKAYKEYWKEISEKNYNDEDAKKLIEKYRKILKHITSEAVQA